MSASLLRDLAWTLFNGALFALLAWAGHRYAGWDAVDLGLGFGLYIGWMSVRRPTTRQRLAKAWEEGQNQAVSDHGDTCRNTYALSPNPYAKEGRP